MLLIILALLFIVNKMKINISIKYLLSLLIISIPTLFSFGLGTDYFSYEYMYKYISFGGKLDNKPIEPLFALMMQISRLLNIEFHLFISAIRLFLTISTLLWIYDNSENIALSVVIYFSMFYLVWIMSAIRQGIVLAIAIHIYFSKRFNYNIWLQMLFAIILSTIHYSALVLLLVPFMQRIKFTKKQHLLLLFLTLIVSTFSLEPILLLFKDISIVSKSLVYLRGNNSLLFSFSTIVRILFYSVVLYFYDEFDDKYNIYIANSFLAGNYIYFVMKFSDVVASRITIYTYILLVILMPKIYQSLKNRGQKISSLFYAIVMLFSVAFFTKENLSYREQVGYKGEKNLFRFDTIKQSNYQDYDNIYSFREMQVIKSKNKITEFKSKINELEETKFNSNEKYISVNDPFSNNYGILTSEGNWLIKPEFPHNYSIKGRVLLKVDYSQLIPIKSFYDLGEEIFNEETLVELASEEFKKQQLIKSKFTTKELIDINDFVPNVEEYVPFPENISNAKITNVKQGDIEFNVIQFKYYHYNLNIYLNESYEPFTDLVMTNFRSYNDEGFLYANTYSGTLIFNNSGKLIWAQ